MTLDFARVFVDQLRLLGQPGDIALAVSTSGKSPNLIYALEEAREKQMLTVAWAGKDGGRFPEVSDYCFIVPSYSIHRIQEVHATAGACPLGFDPHRARSRGCHLMTVADPRLLQWRPMRSALLTAFLPASDHQLQGDRSRAWQRRKTESSAHRENRAAAVS